MPSILDLTGCAQTHLDHYVDPASRRAWHTYDRVGDPRRFEPADALAPALLDAPLRRADVVGLFADPHTLDVPDSRDHALAELRSAIDAVLELTTVEGPRFVDLGLDDPSGAWPLIERALVASNDTPRIKASKVTKMLHRKRPELVPIFDSKVAAYYGVRTRTPSRLWPLLHADLMKADRLLTELAGDYHTSDGRPMTMLRAADIIIWEHQVTSCGAASTR